MGNSTDTASAEELRELYRSLLAKSPLVHCITNYVTVNDCANVLLAVGARAIMSHAPEEVSEVTGYSNALVLNLGGTEYYSSMIMSLVSAASAGIPVVLDPVGVAVSGHRRDFCKRLLKSGSITAIRGNLSELLALIDNKSGSTGVDAPPSVQSDDYVMSIMEELRKKYSSTIICSGSTDYLLMNDGKSLKLSCGSPYMRRVSGTGCMASTLVAAALSVNASPASAMLLFGKAGELAEAAIKEKNEGMGSFHFRLIDALSMPEAIYSRLNIQA